MNCDAEDTFHMTRGLSAPPNLYRMQNTKRVLENNSHLELAYSLESVGNPGSDDDLELAGNQDLGDSPVPGDEDLDCIEDRDGELALVLQQGQQ